jgi:hypothetical protein
MNDDPPDDPPENPFTAERALERQNDHFAIGFKNEQEWRDYEYAKRLEHEAVLKAIDDAREEDPDEVGDDDDADDLNDYDDLIGS